MVLSTCRNYRKTQLILIIDMIYPFTWIPMYTYINIVPSDDDNGSFKDWAWRVFIGWLAVTMFSCSGHALYRSFLYHQDPSKIPKVYAGMLKWLSSSFTFSLVQWISNGVLGYWGAFWITLIIRFFMVIGTALFILDVRRLRKESPENLEALQQQQQQNLSGSGSLLNSSFKCNIM